MGTLEDKVAIVTGAGTGIGKAIAHAFAAEGAKLVIGSRNRINLERTAAELRRDYYATVTVVIADVTNSNQVRRLFKKAMDEHGQLDILVNNAATGGYTPIDQMSLRQWNEIVGVNLTGVFLCTREALKIMRQQRAGRIINIGSISAHKPRLDQSAYSAAKGGLITFTRSTALEGREYGVTAGILHPGLVDVSDEPFGQGLDEPAVYRDDIAAAAVTIAALPPDVNMFDTTVTATKQVYVGRG